MTSTANTIGILLTNTGTPDDCTRKAVRRYLREFLSDTRIIQLPRIIWQPILHGFVLPLRSSRSTHLYQKIWRHHDSPMRITMNNIAHALAQRLNCHVTIGMNYGQPSIQHGLQKLLQQNITKLIVLPLYPQYSMTTTASSYDRVFAQLKKFTLLPQMNFISHYTFHPTYLTALTRHINNFWQQHEDQHHLLISFHGIPKRYIKKGDPYEQHCQETAYLLASQLNLSSQQWTLCYQSQFGYDKWLQPSTQTLMSTLPKKNVKNIDVICPGFAVDCLETLEEIAITGTKLFQTAGGETLRYIPALNEDPMHIELLMDIVNPFFMCKNKGL